MRQFQVTYIARVHGTEFPLWDGVIDAHDGEDARLLASRKALFSHDETGTLPDGRWFHKRDMEAVADERYYRIKEVLAPKQTSPQA